MEQRPLAGLEPACVFRFLRKSVPSPTAPGIQRPSAITWSGLPRSEASRFRQDEWNNVVIFQPGTPGYEDHPPVILQGHMDMVCEKGAGLSH